MKQIASSPQNLSAVLPAGRYFVGELGEHEDQMVKDRFRIPRGPDEVGTGGHANLLEHGARRMIYIPSAGLLPTVQMDPKDGFPFCEMLDENDDYRVGCHDDLAIMPVDMLFARAVATEPAYSFFESSAPFEVFVDYFNLTIEIRLTERTIVIRSASDPNYDPRAVEDRKPLQDHSNLETYCKFHNIDLDDVD